MKQIKREFGKMEMGKQSSEQALVRESQSKDRFVEGVSSKKHKAYRKG